MSEGKLVGAILYPRNSITYLECLSPTLKSNKEKKILDPDQGTWCKKIRQICQPHKNR